MKSLESNQIHWAIGSLESEHRILEKLLYRNNNQHGKTKLFTHMKEIRNKIRKMLSIHLQSVSDNLESNIRGVSSHKLSILELNEISHCLQSTKAILTYCMKVAHLCSRTGGFVVTLLSMKVFVPLYSLILSLIARINKCVVIATLHFEIRFQTLSEQMKHIGTIQPKFRQLVDTTLTSLTLNSRLSEVITQMRTSMSSESADKLTVRQSNIKLNTAATALLKEGGDEMEGEDLGAVIVHQLQPLLPEIESRATSVRTNSSNNSKNNYDDGSDDDSVLFEDEETTELSPAVVQIASITNSKSSLLNMADFFSNKESSSQIIKSNSGNKMRGFSDDSHQQQASITTKSERDKESKNKKRKKTSLLLPPSSTAADDDDHNKCGDIDDIFNGIA